MSASLFFSYGNCLCNNHTSGKLLLQFVDCFGDLKLNGHCINFDHRQSSQLVKGMKHSSSNIKANSRRTFL